MKHDIYTKFGTCWNAADFAPLAEKLKKDCTYVSYDYFYKLKGRGRLTEFFNGQAKENLKKDDEEKIDMHRGYYQKTNSLLKTIKECCIMVRRQDLTAVNIIVFSKRFGKVSSVVGMDPKEVKSIRDIKI